MIFSRKILLILVVSQACLALSIKERKLRDIKRSLIKIYVYNEGKLDATATGFLIDRKGTFATSIHTFIKHYQDTSYIKYTNYKGGVINQQASFVDTSHKDDTIDLKLLRFDKMPKGMLPLDLSNALSLEGRDEKYINTYKDLLVIGNPDEQDFKLAKLKLKRYSKKPRKEIQCGIYKRKGNFNLDTPMIEVEPSGSYIPVGGFSGAPVLTSDTFQFVGIYTAGWDAYKGPCSEVLKRDEIVLRKKATPDYKARMVLPYDDFKKVIDSQK